MIEMLRQCADKFWKRVTKHSDSECWLWMSHVDRDGYGHFQFRHNKDKQKIRAHRVSYMLANNCVVDSDVFVCHKCDNRACVNPNHLYLGDNNTNIADCVLRGRTARGVKNTNSKLTEEQVLRIKLKLADSQSRGSIAKEFDVSKSTISYIANNRTWKHVLVGDGNSTV